MSEPTSRERRGTIILVILAAIIILAMALYKGLSRSNPLETPAIPDNSPAVIIPASSSSHPIDSTRLRHRPRRPSTLAKPPRRARKGHSRDYLSEPVASPQTPQGN